MSNQALLPAPNWFLNSLADCSADGTLAYGSRNGLVLIQSIAFSEGHAPSPEFSLIPNAHKERITGVSWSNRTLNEEAPKYLLASISDDCAVAVWDTDSLSLVQKHHEHKFPIIDVDWTKLGDLQLVSADDKGYMVVWDLVRSEVRVLKPLTSSSKLQPNVLRCSPVNQDIAAVGCKDGLVCIINIKGPGVIQQRHRGHDKAVVSLSWCPDTNKLASSGMDQIIFVWNNGQTEKTIQLPNKSISGVIKFKPGEKLQGNMRQPVLFLKPDLIVSGSMNAEVLSWNLTEESISPTLLHSDHNRGLFCLAAHDKVVWSMAQDRLVIHHNLASNTTSVFSTLGGFVYCIAPCPFAPGRVAVGVGDDSIRIWSMTDTTGKSSSTIWSRVKGKVLSLAWHPEKEGELAFGTSDGRVGICNASNPAKEVLIMRQYHKSSIYRVNWGPAVTGVYQKDKEAPETNWYLYACDDNNAVVYIDSYSIPKPLKVIIRASNPQIKEDIKQKDIAWKPDRSLLALGLEDGSIQLLTAPHLQCIHTLRSHKKMIFYLSWHPSCTAVDEKDDDRQNWLASTSMDQQIHIYNLTSLLAEGTEKVWKGAPLPLEPLSELKHGGKVVCLAWNPHVGGQLVSSSYDMSVKVWDAAKGEVLACYVEHNGCVMSCCWSALHPDIIISGSADFTCRTWKISQSPADSKPVSRSKFREQQKGPTVLPIPVNPSSSELHEPKPAANGIKQSTKPHDKPQQKPSTKVTVFPLSNASFVKNSMDCCVKLLENKGLEPPGKKIKLNENNRGDDQNEVNHFGFFTSQDDAVELFTKEAEALKRMNNHVGFQNLKLWQGDMQQVIKDSIKAKKLDDWLVSMAPSVSHKFWLETCAAYAEQLVEEEKILKAVSYFVSCHKITEAVTVLQKHNLYKEAVALCNLRLPAGDPLLTETLRAWGKCSHDTGNFEIAVQCYIAVGDYEKAATVLYKRKDPNMWQLGTYLAKVANCNELFLSMTIECFYNYLMNQDWDAANAIISEIPELVHLRGVLKTHQLVCSKDKEGLNIEKGSDLSESNESIITNLEGVLDDISSEQFHELVQQFPLSSQLPETKKELLVTTSKLLLLGAAGKKCGNEDWERYIILALHLNYRRSVVVVKERPLHHLFSWLGNIVLTKYLKSFESFKAAAYLATASKDDPELLSKINEKKSLLMDTETACFARLEVLIPNLEKKLATAHAGKTDISKLQSQLLTLKEEKEDLEKTRVAFPNPFIIFCKLQGLVESLHASLQTGQLEELEREMDTFRATIQE
ncbi:gem-associated protein 5-like [Neocloeon triangulifer]|uniref:gem-associated protein 5-like n=1 Tax=Neocloeon triangulifer TaxID=2078957 RepID=UPI00286F615D|nr:gem-associated protein 5-like [Neocloeon triangulifer]